MQATAGAHRLLARADDARALLARPEFAVAIAERTATSCTMDLGSAGHRTFVAVEPAVEGDDIVGAIVRLDLPRSHAARRASTWTSRYGFDQILGDSPAFKSIVSLAKRLATTDLPVLIHGETGTGKELMAHAIHAASARAAGPFVTVNCGAIPQELIASELFGYEKGAFTGANREGQRGKFEQADGGTIFLDEITETSAALQVSLLRVIQDQEVVPVGAGRGRKVDVRIISATNRDPDEVVQNGLLRRDLYYRLNGAVLPLPPLRARREDIAPLAARFCAESGRNIALSPAALALLLAHSWPGNLRELHAVVRSAALLAEGEAIEPHDLPLALRNASQAGLGEIAAKGGGGELRTAEIRAIEEASPQRAATSSGRPRALGSRGAHSTGSSRSSSFRVPRPGASAGPCGTAPAMACALPHRSCACRRQPMHEPVQSL